MKLHLIIILITLSSCLSPLIDEDISSIDPELQLFYQSFIQAGKLRGEDYSNNQIIIYFDDNMPVNLAGQDVSRMDYVIEIRINNIYRNDSILKLILFHELGHGLLKRPHINSYSIMNDVELPYLDLSNNEQILLDELFN